MKKTILIAMFILVLSIGLVSADLSVNPSSATLNFANLEEDAKTTSFDIKNNWNNDSMIIDIEIEDYFNLNENMFDFKSDFILENQSDEKIDLIVDISNLQINFEGFDNQIKFLINYVNESNSSITGTSEFILNLKIPAYSDEIKFSLENIDLDELPGEDFSKTFKIENKGSVTVENIMLTFSDEAFKEKHSIEITPSDEFTLLPGQEKDVKIEGTLSSDIGIGQSESAELQAKVNNVIKSEVTINVQGKNGLIFTDLEYDIRYPRRHGPSDIDGSITEGRTLRITEGARVVIEGYVENIFPDIELRRPTVYLEIRRMDRFEERINLRDLDPSYDEFFKFEFTVPYEGYRDRERFTAELYVEAEDRDTAKKYKTTITFELEIEKEREEVTIINTFIENEVLSCNRKTNLYVTIRNTGRDDLTLRDRNTASLSVRNNNIGLNAVFTEIEMSADDYDSSNEQTFIIPIDATELSPSTILQNIRIIAYHDRDRESDETNVVFRVSECVEETTTTTTITTTTTTIAPTTTTLRQIIGPDATIIPSEPQVERDNERLYIILLVVLIGLVILAVGGMIGYLLVKK
ncbi:MAG: hypothetical protein ACMXX8_00070 [Candidatus Woesearchaeota archaeon]